MNGGRWQARNAARQVVGRCAVLLQYAAVGGTLPNEDDGADATADADVVDERVQEVILLLRSQVLFEHLREAVQRRTQCERAACLALKVSRTVAI